jgi:predicted metalloendopeptidase
MTPQTVNAYYNPSMNEIVMPAGILQIPFFNVNAPMAENFGGIGMVVGHEMSHGFDDQGSQYDDVGNLSDWWSPSIRQTFNQRTQCLVDQYSNYTVANGTVHLDGKLTLGENLADLGGIKLTTAAYARYKTEHAGKPDPTVLGFTPEQQIYVTFGQAWCTKRSVEAEAYYAKIDPHSHPRYRVNGVLVNIPQFADAFSCKTGAPMAPANRCAVW